ncbi:MAG: ABC transporter permease [Christensenellales bacterium]|jgi:putative aldouronate transport system permease protein
MVERTTKDAAKPGAFDYKSKKSKSFLIYFKNHYLLYVMLLVPLVQYFIFHYLPMYGVTIAFKNYNMFKGVMASEWAGLRYFREIFQMAEFGRAVRNTLMLNLIGLVFGFPAPIILALMLNEINNGTFKKVTQTLLYLPHFISWVIIGGMVQQIFATNTGVVNNLLKSIGLKAQPWLSSNGWWIVTYFVIGVWQSIGWGAIIYMSAITSINPEIYEAARVDGCCRIKMVYLITLPNISETIVIMLILAIGGIMSMGFEKPYMLGNKIVMDVSDVLSTFTYRYGLENSRFSIATAVGLFQSVINFILVISANTASRKISDQGIW